MDSWNEAHRRLLIQLGLLEIDCSLILIMSKFNLSSIDSLTMVSRVRTVHFQCLVAGLSSFWRGDRRFVGCGCFSVRDGGSILKSACFISL